MGAGIGLKQILHPLIKFISLSKQKELLKRAQAEGAVVLQELTALGIEKGWLIPNVETAAELPLKHVPRDLAGIESLIEILKVRLGA